MKNTIKIGSLVALIVLTALGISGCVSLSKKISRQNIPAGERIVRLKTKKLLSRLENSDWRVAAQASLELKNMGEASMPIWEKALESRKWQVRSWAVEAVISFLDPTRIDILFPLLKDENKDVRRKAVEAVVKVGGKPVLFKVKPLAKDSDSYVRQAVIYILCKFEDKDSLLLFIEGLKDVDPLVRYESAVALGRLVDQSSKEALEQAKTDEHKWVRYAVEQALKKLNSVVIK